MFTARAEIAALTVGAFNDYWGSSYAKLPVPEGGWPIHAQRLCAEIMANVEVESETLGIKDEATTSLLQPAFVAYASSTLRPLTPTTPVSAMTSLSSPPRPYKPINFFETFTAPQSPSSPVRLRTSLQSTPSHIDRSPLSSRSIASTGRRRREVGDKENRSPRRLAGVESVTDRIAKSPENPYGLKPFGLGKRRAVYDAKDEEWNERPSPLKRCRVNSAVPPSPSPSEAEDERDVAETLLDYSHEDDVSSNVPPPHSPLKRKRVFMEAVELPTLRSLTVERKLRHAASLDSHALGAAVKSSKVLGKMRMRGGALPQGSSSVKRRKSDGGDPFLVSNDEPKAMPVSSDGPSSDDDPHIGQVTPHHLISPQLRTRGKAPGGDGDSDVCDPPSDDSLPSSSPLRDVMARRLHREVSLTKLAL